MKKLLFILILIGISFNCFSQQILNNSIRDVEHLIATGRSLENNDRYADAKGTPYLTENFISAKISPGDKFYWVRYNAYDDEMEVKLNDQKTIVLDNSKGNYRITPKGSPNSYVSLKEVGKDKLGYFVEVLKTNTTSLYKKLEKKYTPETPAMTSYDKDKPAYFSKEKETFYIQLSSEDVLQELPSKQKTFLTLFSNDKEIKDYIKKNKIKLSKEPDLIKLINFINSSVNKG